MYWVPESLFTEEEVLTRFVSEAPQDKNTKVCLKEAGGVRQVVVEKPAGYEARNYAQGDYVLEHMLADMDEAGVDIAVLKVPGANEWMSLEACKFFNDGMADYARRSNGRMVPLAVIPALDFTSECADEIDRCMGKLGFAGVQLCSHYGNKYLDDPVFAPLFECLDGVLPFDGFDVVHDPLFVCVLVFQNPDGSRCCLVSVDATSMRDDSAIRDAVTGALGCDEHAVWVCVKLPVRPRGKRSHLPGNTQPALMPLTERRNI